MLETSFEQDSSIDLLNLKEELQKQPMLYYKWGKKYAHAKASSFKKQEEFKLIKSELKQEVDRTFANLDSAIRSDPSSFGIGKITEKAIESAIYQHHDYITIVEITNEKLRKAIEEVAECIEEEETYEVAKTAMQHKKTSLEKEVALYINEWYSEPKVDKKFRDIQEEETINELNKTMNNN